jgi:hypothetical protein
MAGSGDPRLTPIRLAQRETGSPRLASLGILHNSLLCAFEATFPSIPHSLPRPIARGGFTQRPVKSPIQ